MSEHHFGVGRGKVKAVPGKRIDAIAREHGTTFVWANMPGQGPSYWFATPSRGWLLDGATERAVWRALERAKLAIAGRLSAAVFRKESV